MTEEKEYEIMSFFAAAKTGNLDILQSLKVPVDTTDEFGNTALHWAAGAGHIDAVKYLVDTLKADINKKNKTGDTPLHKAAWRGSLLCIEFLTSKDECDITIRNNDGKRAVDLAKHLEVKSHLQSLEGEEEEDDEEDASSEEE